MRKVVIATAHHGFSLMEIVVSLVATSVLTTGLMSAMFLTLKSTDLALTNADEMIDASDILYEMSELQFATEILTSNSSTIEVYVSNRDGDADEEVVRYSWSAVPGDALIRSYNATEYQILQNVYDFNLTYVVSGTRTVAVIVKLKVGSSTANTIQTEIPLLNMNAMVAN
ncbi:hypothetical protein [Rubinisphaera sp.]|uniref:hypothetical protein n=1 Tax=Rubinisphaera sp. TaxID=2024857 RepID=UPI000C10FE2D|nr:hypothetical protein [Rubinisphaera sp.]MBV10647.1 hypothetical protein [Rubinisphaera sp.]HCS52308.1 hypothetical protein [Planctomycetaceae bacterium]|tara:strand:+ start:50 stop:559 length:510 start_codon:yes stop_codon:yes gene_type:complete